MTPKYIGSYLRPAREGDMADHHQRAMLLSEARSHRAAIEQVFTDVGHWNRTHPSEEPIDPDPNGILRQMADDLDELLMRNTRVQ